MVGVRATLTSSHSLFVEAVAVDTADLASITEGIGELGLSVESSEIVTGRYTRPWSHFDAEWRRLRVSQQLSA